MIMLDASTVTEETTASQADQAAANYRTITLPETAGVGVDLLISRGDDGFWRGGFRVLQMQENASEPVVIGEELPLSQDDDEGCDTIGTAVADAADRAYWWLGTQKPPLPEEAEDALQSWIEEFDPDTCTEAIFNDATAGEKNTESDGPQPAGESAAELPEDPTMPAGETPHLTPARSGTLPSTSEARLIVTDEAQKAYDDTRRALEGIIARLAIEQVNLKASMKNNRDSLKEYTEELEKHLCRGPERLPLFDRQAEPATESPRDLSGGEACQAANRVAEKEQAETKDDDPCPKGGQHEWGDEDCVKCHEPFITEEEIKASEEGKEPWRATKIADLKGLTPKIVEILDGHDIRTVGDWVDMPRLRGIEYTQLKGVTEARYDKIVAAMDKVTIHE